MRTALMVIGCLVMLAWVWRELKWEIAVIADDDSVPLTQERRAMIIKAESRQVEV